MHNSNRTYVSFLILSLLFSCAVQVAPSGGPKDNRSPKVSVEIPENKSLFFDKSEFKISFDEFVVLKNPEEQIVVSPPLEEAPEFIVNGRVLRVHFRSRLKRNTTYTINFGNAITDNHEGNVLENLSYVFSTGKDLDTNKITGIVYNAFTAKPEKNIVIGLYDAETFYDSIIYKNKPEYFSKTKETGHFSIENIPNKKFILVGFNDENKNFKYNKNEDLLFSENFINPLDTLNYGKIFRLYSPDIYKVNHMLDTFCKEKGKFSFVVYKPTNISLKPFKNNPSFSRVVKTKNNLDTLYVFSNDLKNDSIVSFNIEQPDTSFPVSLTSRKKYKLPPFSIGVSSYLDLNDTMLLFYSNPYKTINIDRIILKEDTIIVKPKFINDSSFWLTKIYYPLKEKTKYSLMVKDSAFTDIFNQYNKKVISETTTKSIKDYSSLNLKLLLNNSANLYIIQLINDDESIVYKEFSINQTTENLFEFLTPGNYKIKIIKDSNKNGKWDNGDYFLKREPEQVYYYPEIITLKAYWDLDQLIDLNLLINK